MKTIFIVFILLPLRAAQKRILPIRFSSVLLKQIRRRSWSIRKL